MTAPSHDRLSADDLAKILELVEKSDFDMIELSVGDFHFSASRRGAPLASHAPLETPPHAAAPAAARPSASPAAQAPMPTPVDDPGLIPVKAPIVGIFYPSPEPGAAPFVAVGDRIEPGTTVGLIEVMKVFNAVAAGISGTVVRRLVEDSDLVEYGQPLFLIRPEGA